MAGFGILLVLIGCGQLPSSKCGLHAGGTLKKR